METNNIITRMQQEIDAANAECVRLAAALKQVQGDYGKLLGERAAKEVRALGAPIVGSVGDDDAMIIAAVEEAKVYCVHPQAATTIDIGRAVLSAERRALADRAAPSVPVAVAGEFRANARNPEAVFADWCDQQGYPSDGEMDAALRGAFYEGIRFCCVDADDNPLPVPAAPIDRDSRRPALSMFATMDDYKAAMAEHVAAVTPLAVPQRPTDDELWDATIRDRDTYHEWADKLAGAIAIHFGAEIGEHSNMNCPWAEALGAIESAAPAPLAVPLPADQSAPRPSGTTVQGYMRDGQFHEVPDPLPLSAGPSEQPTDDSAKLAIARTALERIARWTGEFPPTSKTQDDGTPTSYAAEYGSNGERDYMRQVAETAYVATAGSTSLPVAVQLTGSPELKTWPTHIWLQHQFEYTPDFEIATRACSEITWSQDNVDRFDIEYVRADLAGVPVTERQEQGEPIATVTLGGVDGEELGDIDIEIIDMKHLEALQYQMVRTSDPVYVHLYLDSSATHIPTDKKEEA